MTGPRVTRALELAVQLEDAGLNAYVDPSEALANLPAVLVRPPALSWTDGTYAGPLLTWSLTVIASSVDPAAAWAEIDDLLDQVADVFTLATATPASFALPETDVRPCYVATFQE